MSFWDNISVDDFEDSDIALLIDIVGLKIFKRIIETFGGDSFYVPKAESIIRQGRDRQIYKEFRKKGLSYKGLAKKYKLTVSHIRVIINAQQKTYRQASKLKPAKQMKLFKEKKTDGNMENKGNRGNR